MTQIFTTLSLIFMTSAIEEVFPAETGEVIDLLNWLQTDSNPMRPLTEKASAEPIDRSVLSCIKSFEANLEHSYRRHRSRADRNKWLPSIQLVLTGQERRDQDDIYGTEELMLQPLTDHGTTLGFRVAATWRLPAFYELRWMQTRMRIKQLIYQNFERFRIICEEMGG